MGKGTDPRIELELALFSLCEDQPITVVQTPIAATPIQSAPQPFVSAPVAPVVAPSPVTPAQPSESPDLPPWTSPEPTPAVAHASDAVSYTHLDVYKRQGNDMML